MTRKRFVKRLMAVGFDRNFAMKFSRGGPANKSYAQRWEEIAFHMMLVSGCCNYLSRAMEETYD
ncbi:hypothetical protein RFF05_06680 [Bengtsoniella intestinalis]|uniref:hypothetical protein n=1 Tax=Bengtsoniella intestinalis TaxID=3073143 RepID=UPI00391F0234